MSNLDDKIIEDVLMANDIVDVVSNYVSLKKKGRNYFGLCPFHNEKTPSFSVSQEKQIFHCFGCKKGGNAIHFIQQIENISFFEALKILAEKANIKIPDRRGYNDPNALLRDRMKAVNEDTAKYFQSELLKPTAKVAQDYINKRKINIETLKTFRIGYSRMGLYKYLKDKGYADKEILETGLVYKRDDGRYIDRFRDRLMFPISDITGTVIAFGGRILEDKAKLAKYINSNENLVYSKGNHLYALNIAKRYAQDQLIITEGYMDTISLQQRGIKNVVASLGTALTERQAKLIARTTKQAIIAYDSDASGQDAALRGLDILNKTGVDLRVLELDGAKDPDEYIIKYGKDMFEKQVLNSISLVEFKVKVLRKKFDINIPNEKIKFFKEIAKVISTVEEEISREIYIDRISKKYDISKDAIYADVRKIDNAKLAKNENLNSKIAEEIKNKENTVKEIDIKREEYLIYVFLENMNNEEIKKEIKENVDLNSISSETNKKIFEYIFKSEHINKEIAISNIKDEELRNKITEIYAQDIQINRNKLQKSIREILKQFEINELKKEREEILLSLKDTKITSIERKDKENKLKEIIKKLNN